MSSPSLPLKLFTVAVTVTLAAFANHTNRFTTQDFSEDTYRTLAAADNCVMLVDAAKGIEDRTRKLFEVNPRTHSHTHLPSLYLPCMPRTLIYPTSDTL